MTYSCCGGLWEDNDCRATVATPIGPFQIILPSEEVLG
jgi:hypothetical protein